jgi:hypothetical protein
VYVYCDACDYDSGDRDTPDQLADKVNGDGGRMVTDPGIAGWSITCPNGHGDDHTHMD